MSHFSRPMHLFSRYVSAREETRPVHSTPPPPPPLPPSSFPPLSPSSYPPSPSGLYLTAPHTMAPDAANFAALLPVHRSASPFLSLSLPLASVRRTPLPLRSSSFFFPFAAVRFLFFFSLLPSRPRSFSLRRRRTRQPAVDTHHARVPRITRALVHFQRKGRTRAARLLPRYGCPCRKLWDFIGIGERRNDHRLSNRLCIIKVVISLRDLVFSRSRM